MIQARAKIEQARLDKDVYEKYVYEQNRATKQSDLDQATAEHERVVSRSDAEVRTAESELASKKYSLESAKQKNSDLLEQLGFCTVRAPSTGLVVYYSSTQGGGMGRNEGRPPQVGTELTRNEPVIILPDTSQMVASVKISEALVGQIQKGQKAAITCDAMADRPMYGEVLSVGVMAESGGWRDPNRRDYTVKILIHEGKELGLKPSMRCKAVINVGHVDEAVHVPVQAIFRDGALSYVYVPDGSGYSQRKVSTGRSSELFMEVVDGLKEGETVLLREPEADEVVSRLEGIKPKSSTGPAGAESTDQPPANGAAAPAMPQPSNGPAMGGTDGAPSNGPGMGGGNRGPGMGGRNRGERRPGGERPTQGGGGSTDGASAPAAPGAK
jgi:multidrug efflux pump subunit AcrA (membrane-fusion protein)